MNRQDPSLSLYVFRNQILSCPIKYWTRSLPYPWYLHVVRIFQPPRHTHLALMDRTHSSLKNILMANLWVLYGIAIPWRRSVRSSWRLLRWLLIWRRHVSVL
jgi:hypothetical protein